ncbi:hypothetical protein D3C73_1523240 [compost metagenome]
MCRKKVRFNTEQNINGPLIFLLQLQHFFYIIGKFLLRHCDVGKGMLFRITKVGSMVANADDRQSCGDAGFNVITDITVSMTTAKMMGM